MQIGGVVLCGGRSSRMGQSKALLPFGGEALLTRIVRILSGIVDPIVVVAAADQKLPPLPARVRILRDVQEYAGPLAAMSVGLSALADEVEAAYVSACDVPLLRPQFVQRMIAALDDFEAAVPREKSFYHPLAGIYRTSLAPRIAALIQAGELRPQYLLETIRAQGVPLTELRAIDGVLDSLRNVNTVDEYRAALRDAGISAEMR